jgi:ABC-2 type transport system permease protein
MRKIWTILKSEFWRRVRTKGFILSTLLAPAGLVALMVLPGLLAFWAASGGADDAPTVVVADETERLLPDLKEHAGDAYQFEPRPDGTPTDSLRSAVLNGDYDAFLVLPQSLLNGQGEARYYSTESSGFTERFRLGDFVEDAVRDVRLDAEGTPVSVRAIMDASVPVQMRRLTTEGEEGGGAVLTAIGFAMGFLIYMMVFIYGQFVMQGVIEEKATRVVEVVVSSVRPFQLLLGKVLGIGAMALSQVVLWSVCVVAGLAFAAPLMALFIDPTDLDLPQGAEAEAMMEATGITLPTVPVSLLVWFVLFFAGGYLLYSSLFAAAGSAVEQQQDAQSLVFPITIPLLIPIVFAQFIIESPNSSLAVWLSGVPFFSPILMPIRIAAGAAPFWQILLAFVLLMITFLAMIWLSARIYRTGILMYGKKAGFAEMWRWVRR